jgi:hypothetical protein
VSAPGRGEEPLRQRPRGRAPGVRGLGGRVHTLHEQRQLVGERNGVADPLALGEFLGEPAEPLADPALVGDRVPVGRQRRVRELRQGHLERAAAAPLRPHLPADRAFGASLAANTLVFFVNFGTLLFFSQYLQLVLGLSPLAAGLWTVPQFVAFIAGSMLTPQAVRRVRPAFAMAGGLAIAALGFAMFARVDGASGPAAAVAASVVYSFGLAP